MVDMGISSSKIEKVPRGIRGEKSSKDMSSSRNLVSTIGALASPKMGDGIMKSPSPKCYMTFWDMTIYNTTLNWSDITPICELITELDFIIDYYQIFGVSMEHCNGCG